MNTGKNDCHISAELTSGPDKTDENQVGASGWFVRLNLFARSQNPPFGRLVVWWFGRDRVYRKGLSCEIKRCFAMRDFKVYFWVKVIFNSIFMLFPMSIF